MVNFFSATPVDMTAGENVILENARAVSQGCLACNGGWLAFDVQQQSANVQLIKPGVYKLDFTGQVTAAAAGDVVLALKVNGEEYPGTEMGVTITAAGDLANVSAQALVRVPCYGPVTVSVGAADDSIDFTRNNFSYTITRIC